MASVVNKNYAVFHFLNNKLFCLLNVQTSDFNVDIMILGDFYKKFK
uniref:Alpha alpha-trehalose-phosphate synthase UDP-forming 5-like n=1 Tax=Rhizophora mucronata TaxID=61149 RepID=A0A2P2MI40_RHIMU